MCQIPDRYFIGNTVTFTYNTSISVLLFLRLNLEVLKLRFTSRRHKFHRCPFRITKRTKFGLWRKLEMFRVDTNILEKNIIASTASEVTTMHKLKVFNDL